MGWKERALLVLLLALGGYACAWLLGRSTLVEGDLPGVQAIGAHGRP